MGFKMKQGGQTHSGPCLFTSTVQNGEGYNMKFDNKNSYSDLFSKANQKTVDAENAARMASIEEQKVNDEGTPLDLKKPAPTKIWGQIIKVATDALKEDTARQERANNRYIQLSSMPGGLNAVM